MPTDADAPAPRRGLDDELQLRVAESAGALAVARQKHDSASKKAASAGLAGGASGSLSGALEASNVALLEAENLRSLALANPGSGELGVRFVKAVVDAMSAVDALTSAWVAVSRRERSAGQLSADSVAAAVAGCASARSRVDRLAHRNVLAGQPDDAASQRVQDALNGVLAAETLQKVLMSAPGNSDVGAQFVAAVTRAESAVVEAESAMDRRGAEDAAAKLATLDARVRAADGELAGARALYSRYASLNAERPSPPVTEKLETAKAALAAAVKARRALQAMPADYASAAARFVQAVGPAVTAVDAVESLLAAARRRVQADADGAWYCARAFVSRVRAIAVLCAPACHIDNV